MPSPFTRRSARAVIAAAGFGLVVSPLAMIPAAQAAPDGSGLVISEVYGGGGATTGSPSYAADFVELYNPTEAPISLSGLSLQYRSATFASTGTPSVAALSDQVVPANDHFLVQVSTGSVGAALPKPDLVTSATLNMAAGAGQVLLAKSATPFTVTGDLAGNGALLDMVGYGSTPTSFETARTGTALTNTSSASRKAGGGTDTDDNSADFTAGAPSPQPAQGDTAPPPPEELELTIAEIQGEGDVSPHVGDIAVTTGKVTATYPSGGFNGFYIQTPGTGGDLDLDEHDASHGIFVFSSADAAKVAVGDHVSVKGNVVEHFGMTQLTPVSGGVTVLEEPAPEVKPAAVVYPDNDADRESLEGMLIAPQGDYTVTDNYSLNQFGEIGLATGTTTLKTPTEVARWDDAAGIAAAKAEIAARGVRLDDGSSVNFMTNANKSIPLPYLSMDAPVRVGAPVTFTQEVILDFRNSSWKFQPTQRITGDDEAPATFADNRTDRPEDVGGDVKIASFNVLNYFTETGEKYVAKGNACSYYNDRDGNPITVNTCSGEGPRGAANATNLERQQDKIVTALNALDADVVSLEEIENSAKFGPDRDAALSALVDALNEGVDADVWEFVPSPADVPAVSTEDVIRNAFIYKKAAVSTVGESVILEDPAFHNARDPLAQAFKPTGSADDKAFTVIVNHFKSKGSGADDGTGQGNANPDRVAQAEALVAFADEMKTELETDSVFLSGDFNAYTLEQPMQVFYDAGYTNLGAEMTDEHTYLFGGTVGSLDHILANEAATATVTGADIWNINSVEPIALEYSRFNYNATSFYAPDQFRASDHDPLVVGLDIPGVGVEQIQVLGTNDFHGRLTNNASGTEAGAATLAGAVKELRKQYENTVFAAAGDLIGASTFESFIAQDKPTIDALNEAGLEVSAVGNHEFDAGYDDLLKRVMAPYDPETNPFGGAEWEYIGANVHKPGAPESELLEPTWVRDFGDVEVGFIGAVTEHLHELVSPAGIEGVEIEDIVTATNREADRLTAAGVDVVVLLVHEGAANTSMASATDPETDFGRIVNGVDGDVDAIVSGHTHLAYNHAIPVQEWIDEGREVTERPVVSAGQYGTNLNQLLFSVDAESGDVVEVGQKVLALKTGQVANYPTDQATKKIVDAAVAEAEVLGAKPLGEIANPFNRAKLANGTTENRGGESTAGNLVAEVQRWATESANAGSAEIAFMNPGGLRADMVGTGEAYPRTLTYKQAAEMQPFANTLVNMQLTGAQIAQVLEQQWQPSGASRPFLKLGTSQGFTYTYDPTAEAGSRIKGMWLHGEAIDPARSYSVTANSFLAAGGDNFSAFNQATSKRDTGKIDLQAMVDYMAEFASSTPVAADPRQRAVGIAFPATAPESYRPGDKVAFKVSSLAYSTSADVKDTQVKVSLGDAELGTFDVDNTIGTDAFDEYGKADVEITLPQAAPKGAATLTVTGLTTGTSVPVSIVVEETVAEKVPSRTTATASPAKVKFKKDTSELRVEVAAEGVTPTGTVKAFLGDRLLDSAELSDGAATLVVGPFDTVGTKQIDVRYLGSDQVSESSTSTTVQVVRATPRMRVDVRPHPIYVKKSAPRLGVTLTAPNMTVRGKVVLRRAGEVIARGRLEDGKVRLRMAAFPKTGKKTVRVRYLGNKVTAPTVRTVTIRVVR